MALIQIVYFGLMITKNSKIYLIAGITLTAILAMGVHSVSAQEQPWHDFHNANMPEITGSLEATNSIQDNLSSLQIDLIEAAGIVEKETGGKFIMGSLVPYQGYLVYAIHVIDEKTMYGAIVDAGNGDILFTSNGIYIEKLQEMHEKNPDHMQKMMRVFSIMFGENIQHR